jgi:hypothetical protein
MTNEITLTQLTAAVEQLRQQVAQANQRLDMIYGAVTRSSESARPETNHAAKATSPSPTNPFSATMMMNPGDMLHSLRQHAQDLGLTISSEAVERLQAELPEYEG